MALHMNSPAGWCLAGLLVLGAAPARAQIQIASADGKQSFKLGLLGQFQAEAIDSAVEEDVTSKNLFIRRFRIMGEVKISPRLGVFFETDVPNLGKGNPDGTKSTQDVFIQDAHATYSHDERFNVDVGMIYLVQSYNHLQSAASLMTLEYGPYTFVESGPTTSRNGRDYGVRLRGLLAKHLEYRLYLLQGFRGVESGNPLRFQGRVAWAAYGAQTGFFYRGTSLGKTRTLAIGANWDVQKSYKEYGGDVYYDQPLGAGDGLTLQANLTHWDGGSLLPSLPEQNTTLVEAGYYFHGAKLLPYVQYARQDFKGSQPDEQRPEFGIGYYFIGHNSNLKAAYTRIDRDGSRGRNQFRLQYQAFVF